MIFSDGAREPPDMHVVLREAEIGLGCTVRAFLKVAVKKKSNESGIRFTFDGFEHKLACPIFSLEWTNPNSAVKLQFSVV